MLDICIYKLWSCGLYLLDCGPNWLEEMLIWLYIWYSNQRRDNWTPRSRHFCWRHLIYSTGSSFAFLLNAKIPQIDVSFSTYQQLSLVWVRVWLWMRMWMWLHHSGTTTPKKSHISFATLSPLSEKFKQSDTSYFWVSCILDEVEDGSFNNMRSSWELLDLSTLKE